MTDFFQPNTIRLDCFRSFRIRVSGTIDFKAQKNLIHLTSICNKGIKLSMWIFFLQKKNALLWFASESCLVERKSYTPRMTSGRVNNGIISIFGWTNLLRLYKSAQLLYNKHTTSDNHVPSRIPAEGHNAEKSERTFVDWYHPALLFFFSQMPLP